MLLEDRSLAFSLPPSASSELDWKGLLILENFFFLSFSMAARAELLNPPSLDSEDSSSFCLHAQVCLLYKILLVTSRRINIYFLQKFGIDVVSTPALTSIGRSASPSLCLCPLAGHSPPPSGDSFPISIGQAHGGWRCVVRKSTVSNSSVNHFDPESIILA